MIEKLNVPESVIHLEYTVDKYWLVVWLRMRKNIRKRLVIKKR